MGSTGNERLPSGIEGLDEVLLGGFISNRSYLLIGPTGSGKTIFSIQWLLEGMRNGEACLYMTFTEPPGEIKRNLSSFGWELDSLPIVDPMADIVGSDIGSDEYQIFSPDEVEQIPLWEVIYEELKKRNIKCQSNLQKNAYIIFISAYYYNGYSAFQNGVKTESGSTWIYEYSKQSAITDEYCEVAAGSDPCCNEDGTAKSNDCCGVENFINYCQSCKMPTLGNQQAAGYGLRLLGHYKALLECEKYDEAQHEENLIGYLASQNDPVEEEAEEGEETAEE